MTHSCSSGWEGATLDTLDAERAARLVAFRSVHAPIVDSCWRFFDARIRIGGIAGVAARVAADQGLLMPPSLVAFFVSQGCMEGLSAIESVHRARESFLPAASKALPYWCAVHSLTFSVVPVQYRMAWASLCAVGWNAMMSNENQAAKLRENGGWQGGADNAETRAAQLSAPPRCTP